MTYDNCIAAVRHPEEPPFNGQFLDAMVALCDRDASWPPGETRGDYYHDLRSNCMTYKGRQIGQSQFGVGSPQEVGGVLLFGLSAAVITLADGTELEEDEFYCVLDWYDKAAEFLTEWGWTVGGETVTMEGESLHTWFPPLHVCSKCPHVLQCKTKRLT